MPKYNPIYTKQFDQVLLQLVETIGDNKWAEITRQMKTIYGFNIPRKPMVQARWRAIDPKINRDPFNAEDLVLHWNLCVKHKCHWDAVREEYKNIGQERDKSYLSQKFYAYFQSKLIDLNKAMGKIPMFNRNRIETLRDTTKKRVLELHDRNLDTLEDEHTKEVIISCKVLIKILTFTVENHTLAFDDMIDQVLRIISRDKFQKVLENIFIIDQVVLIACNVITAIDENKDFADNIDDTKKQKYKKPTQIKTWDEALEEPSSDDHSEDEDILNAGIKMNKTMPNTHLTKADTVYAILIRIPHSMDGIMKPKYRKHKMDKTQLSVYTMNKYQLLMNIMNKSKSKRKYPMLRNKLK